MRRPSLILVVTGASLLAVAAFSRARPTGPAEPWAGVREMIGREIQAKRIPSVSLAVIKDGGIVWEEAFGLADLENRVEATPRTVYPIASVTKPFTATAIMILAERGLVDLDRPAGAYLPQGSLKAFEGDVAGVTIRRLLQHTSGLAMFWDIYFEGASRQRPPLETVLRRYAVVVSPPGGGYNYSNLGYAVLESVIERVSGSSYSDFMTTEVFRPLGLSRTEVLTSPRDRPDTARKYGPSLAPVPFCDHSTRGASAIYATARDLASFLLLHLRRLRPDQQPILQPRSIDAMRTARDPDVRYSSYALGWETGRRFGYPIVTHGGAMDGCRAHLAMIPSEGLGVAVLINGENLRSIQVCDGVFAALLPAYAKAMEAAGPGQGGPPSQPAFRPPAGAVGTWEGSIQTHEGNIPVRLSVGPDGRVEIFRLGPDGRPGEGLTPLKPPSVNQGVLVVHFPQVFATSDATAPNHRTVLGLHIGSGRLSGEANTIAADMSYSFPSYISLRRIETTSLLHSALLRSTPPMDVDTHAPAALKRRRAGPDAEDPASCTIVMAARDGQVLAGNNEDRDHPQTIVTFVPATKDYFGRIVFGYDDAPVQGGLNDQGLFIDGNALRPTGWRPDPDKPAMLVPVMTTILASCATCADVEALFGKWNVRGLAQARFPVADRTGASMVVEYGRGRVRCVRSDTWYQIATNFVMSNIEDGNYPCWRYRTADKILSEAKELSLDLVREVLEKTRQSGSSRTVYSNIYDLKRGLIHVYNLGDFETAVVLDLAEELKKGQRTVALSALFDALFDSR